MQEHEINKCITLEMQRQCQALITELGGRIDGVKTGLGGRIDDVNNMFHNLLPLLEQGQRQEVERLHGKQ